ncbi:MAG TPA: dihydroorotate dehydrogenase electron transfer subunit [Nitrospirae bacterium]|nr:dihydroorotate dehydrogenase electron transfer subunit [Nitrospirota bacterium]
MLSVDSGLDPLLKRPFSLHRWLGGDFQLLYETVGKATNILKYKAPGNVLEMIGPLGNGFPAGPSKTGILLVAGGLGIAPVFALAESVSSRRPLLFLGAKSRKEVLCIEKLRSLGIRPTVTTDDGSLGKKGLITDILIDFLSRQSSTCLPVGKVVNRYRVYACGPKPMLREMSRITKKFRLKGYLALEENMACGVGACLSCVVNTTDGLKRVCKEGPVFPAEEIIW